MRWTASRVRVAWAVTTGRHGGASGAIRYWTRLPPAHHHHGRTPKAGVMSAGPYYSVRAGFAAAMLSWTLIANAQDAPVLLGTWTLNIDKTEPAIDRVVEDARATRGSGSGGPSNVRLTFGGMTMASKTLKVTQADSIITIEDDDGPLFVNLRADNKTLEEKLANQSVVKTRAQWRKNELIVERVHETDGSARMIIRMDPRSPKVLIVDFHYENKRQGRTIDQRRIYEAGM